MTLKLLAGRAAYGAALSTLLTASVLAQDSAYRDAAVTEAARIAEGLTTLGWTRLVRKQSEQ